MRRSSVLLGIVAIMVIMAADACAGAPDTPHAAPCRGTLRVTSQRDLTGLHACTDFVGTMEVHGSAVTHLSALSQLTVITGSLFIGPTTNLSTIAGLDSLHTITGSLVIDTNMSADGLYLPRLQRVGGDLVITENLAMTGISLPALEVVESNMIIAGNPALTRLILTAFTKVRQDLFIVGNRALEIVQITAPLDIGGFRYVTDNPKLFRSALEAQPSLHP